MVRIRNEKATQKGLWVRTVRGGPRTRPLIRGSLCRVVVEPLTMLEGDRGEGIVKDALHMIDGSGLGATVGVRYP